MNGKKARGKCSGCGLPSRHTYTHTHTPAPVITVQNKQLSHGLQSAAFTLISRKRKGRKAEAVTVTTIHSQWKAAKVCYTLAV